MPKRFHFARLIAAALLGGVCPASLASELKVFAAASLTDVCREIGTNYQARTGVKLVLNFGASSFLERQLEAGAGADVFFSADEAKMDLLERQGLILTNTRVSRLGNALVIVVPKDSALVVASAKTLATSVVKRIALADPETVPAGIYARKYLEKEKLWTTLQPKVVPTDNVRAALAAVESGNVEAGIVFQTDAGISKQVKVALAIPSVETPEISYPLAVLRDSKRVEAARALVIYLNSDEAGKVFQRYGFTLRSSPRPATP